VSTYEPGTVAVATIDGEQVRVSRFRDEGWMLLTDPDYFWPDDGNAPVTDVRPLVVLDLDGGEAKELADYLSGVDMHLSIGDRLNISRQILQQTKPPRILEPGLWGIVTAREENAITEHDWVHLPTGAWASLGGSRLSTWRNLIDPTLIREGVSS
jgi:hypothetical protein